jgi:hypothetical protein
MRKESINIKTQRITQLDSNNKLIVIGYVLTTTKTVLFDRRQPHNPDDYCHSN